MEVVKEGHRFEMPKHIIIYPIFCSVAIYKARLLLTFLKNYSPRKWSKVGDENF